MPAPGPARTRRLAAALAAPLLLALTLWPAPAAAGEWRWPLPPPHEVVGGFDPPDRPWLPGHRGVDLAGAAGAPVRAAGAGVVAFAGKVAGVAVVSVRHANGWLTTYEPVEASVHRGETVLAGQRIGRLVLTGSHCAPRACLHWGLRDGAAYLDPLALVGLGRVRLLPLYAATPGGAAPWAVPLAGGAVAAAGGALLARRRVRR